MARAGLTPELVTRAAAELADTHGWQQLTLAAVAAELGVRQPSLYKHVASLAALRQSVSLIAVTELAEHLGTAVAGRSGADALHHLAQQYRLYARAHPGRYQASVIAPCPNDQAHLEATTVLLATLTAVLRGYGLTDEPETVHAIRALRALLHGFVSLEAGGGFALELDLNESFSHLVAGFDLALQEQTRTRSTP